ncbi:MAG: MATE family efflux transporter [Planctomycetota bacterium]
MLTPLLRAELGAMLRLAWPVVVSQVGLMFMGVVDTIMLGHYGADELAAVAAANVLATGVMLVVPLGVLGGMDPVISQAWGAGHHAAAGRTLRRGLVLAAVLSVPLMIGVALTAQILGAVGQPAHLLPHVANYSLWLIPGCFPVLAFGALRNTMTAVGDVRPILWVTLSANLVNAGGNALFIFGSFGMPAMGVAGAGLATTLARIYMVLALYVIARHHGTLQRIRPTAPWQLWEWRAFRMILRVGLPIALLTGLEVGAFGMFTLMAGWLSASTLAGHQITLNMAALMFMMAVGVSAASSVRVGHAIGRRDEDGARRAAVVAFGLGGVIMLGSTLLFALLPGPLASLYTPPGEVRVIAVRLIPIAAWFQLVDGTQAVAFGVLRGAGDTRAAALLGLAGFYGLAVPLAGWLAFCTPLGAVGIWIAIVFGLGFVAILAVARVWWRLHQPLVPLEAEHGAASVELPVDSPTLLPVRDRRPNPLAEPGTTV